VLIKVPHWHLRAYKSTPLAFYVEFLKKKKNQKLEKRTSQGDFCVINAQVLRYAIVTVTPHGTVRTVAKLNGNESIKIRKCIVSILPSLLLFSFEFLIFFFKNSITTMVYMPFSAYVIIAVSAYKIINRCL
jgi:hypothetical protein